MTDNKNTRLAKTPAQQYAFWVRFAAISASVTALVLVLLKLYAWFVTDAGAMLASATDSALDLFASLSSVFILRYALAPADDEHRFGHGKAESLAGLVQSAFVLGSALVLFINGISRLHTPKMIEHSTVGIVVSLIAIVLTLSLVALQKWVIKLTDSVVISADALHYQSDLMLNIGVLVALFLSGGIFVYADGIFTILVALFLFYGAITILSTSIEHLMDKELSATELQTIKDLVLAHPEVLGLHALRTRRAGPQRFIQFHLELDDNLLLVDAHHISESIEKELQANFSPCDVFIHQDPSSVVPKTS